jgi:nucleoid-associated protein
MQVRRIVIHQLEKEFGERGIKEYNSSKKLIPINDRVEKMCSLIHDSFEKDKTRYCKFELSKVNNSVMKNINAYMSDVKDEVFLLYTHASLDTLASSIQNETFATGGYYVFTDYEVNGTRYISIIIARKKDGVDFQWKDDAEVFNLLDSENVNTDKLAMGFRLNWPLYDAKETQDRNYIALLTNQGDKFSVYFTNWVNASGIVNSKIQSDILVSAIKNLGSGSEEDDLEFEKRAYATIKSFKKANKGRVNINTISEALYGDSEKLRSYIESQLDKEIDAEIHIDHSSIKKLIQFEANVKGINLSFDSSKLGNEVRIVDNVLVIENSDLIRQIQEQNRATNG